jgi:hypothetical protein
MSMDESPRQLTPAHDYALIDSTVAGWYAANPRIRRAYAYQMRDYDVGEPKGNDIYVLVDVEPVMDSEEGLPVWLAHSGAWQLELQARTACTVHLGWLHPDETTVLNSVGGGAAARSIGVWFSRNDA